MHQRMTNASRISFRGTSGGVIRRRITALLGGATMLTLAASPSLGQALPSGERLIDGCFPDGTVMHAYARSPGNPWLPGEWNAEAAGIVGTTVGITPFEGATMLQVNPAGGFASQVSQVVNVTNWSSQIDSGMVIVRFSVRVNAAAVTAAPTMFVLAGVSQTVVGTLNPVGGVAIQGYNRASGNLTTDASTATWQTMSACLAVPIGTRFLHFEIAGTNSIMPASGIFFDCASVELFKCQMLTDGGFEPGAFALQAYTRPPLGPGWLPGQWNAESAAYTGPFGCVTPWVGSRMLRVLPTGGATSQVSQIIDVSTFANAIDAGGICAQFSSWFNASVAGTQPRVFLLAGQSQNPNGTLVPTAGAVLNRRTLAMNQDADCSTWQAIGGTMNLPIGTRYLHYELSVPNGTTPPSGVFFDEAMVCLKPALRRFGMSMSPLGAASLDDAGGAVSVTHIGGTGQDGVEFFLGEVDQWQGTFAGPLNAATLPSGVVLRHELRGTVNGQSERTIFVTTITDIGSLLEVNVDSSSLGPTTQNLLVYNGGTLVAHVSGHTGPAYRVAATSAADSPCYVHKTGAAGSWCCSSFASAISVQIVGGPTVLADRVVVELENPTAAVGAFSSLQIRAANIPSLTMTDGSVINVDFSPVCPCDWNQSGSITSQDFFDFISGFFTGDADFNRDGQTTSQDFFDFLGCFFAPPEGC